MITLQEYSYLLIGNIVLGALLRVVIICMVIYLLRSLVKDKKKKSNVKLEIKDTRSKVFIGYIAILSFFYFVAIDVSQGFDENFNSLIWVGMFIPEVSLAISSLYKKFTKAKEEKLEAKKEALAKQKKELEAVIRRNEKIEQNNNNTLKQILESI